MNVTRLFPSTRKVLASTFGAMVLTVGLSSPTAAVADDSEDDSLSLVGPSMITEDSLLTDTPVPAAVTVDSSSGDEAVLVSPAGCQGSTDYPHKSGIQASAHGRTKCNQAVPRVEVVTALYRDRWFGLQPLKVDTSARSNKETSYDATPHWACRGVADGKYRAFSAHASREGGKIYRATSRNWQIPGVSQFSC